METDISQLEKDLGLKYPAISVSQLSEYLSRKMRADEFLSKIYVVGEISNLADKGHIHFKLKEEDSLINCIMFSSNRDNIENEIDDGKEVLVGGSIRYYPKHGTAQIIVKSIFPLKEGYKSLTKKRTEQKLKSEGLFKSENKKTNP